MSQRAAWARVPAQSTVPAVLLLILLLLILVPPVPVAACTAFAVASDETVCGANLDWPDDLDGYVLFNPRGLEKTLVPWEGFGPVEYDGEPVTWLSKYASLTLTCSGRDFIEGGMNERGLILEQANLTSVYPPDDGRPGMSSQQWMQYALDNYQSVGELVDHVEDIRQDGEGWHYLAVDRSGDWAVIEFLDGSPVVFRVTHHAHPVLTNATYEQAESHVALDVRFGGELDVGSGDDSYARFVRTAKRLLDRRMSWLDFSPEPAEPVGLNALGRIDFAFALLNDVSAEDTQRSVVYDTGDMRVYWRSRHHDEVRYVSFAGVERGEGSGVRAIPIHATATGDATDLFEPLSDKQSEELTEHVRELIGGADDREEDRDQGR